MPVSRAPASVSRAPTALVADVLRCVAAERYDEARGLVEQVLAHEPRNEMMLEYRAVLQQAQKAGDDAAEATTDDDDTSSSGGESSSDDDAGDDDDAGEHKNGAAALLDVDDAPDDEAPAATGPWQAWVLRSGPQRPFASLIAPPPRAKSGVEVSETEMRADLERFGLAGTKQELVRNLRFIRGAAENAAREAEDAAEDALWAARPARLPAAARLPVARPPVAEAKDAPRVGPRFGSKADSK